MATHSCILACIIPWTEEPGRLPSLELQRVGHDLVTKQLQHTIFKTHTKTPSSKNQLRDFPGGPVVTDPPCNAGAAGLIPSGRTEIPSAVGELSPHAASIEPTCSGAHVTKSESQCIATKGPS